MPPLVSLLDVKQAAAAAAAMEKNSSKVVSESDAKSESLCSLDLGGGGDALQKSKPKKVNRRRSKSMSLPSAGEQQCKDNPLFFKASDLPGGEDEGGEEEELAFRQPRGPLGVITSLISCWHHHKSSTAEQQRSKAWEKRRAAALVELNKRQQAALADKQDTIDMLEWQLGQLQVMASREHELQELESSSSTACPKPAAIQDEPQEDFNGAGGVRELAATVLLFEMAVIRARLSIRYFCNIFIKQMEVSGHPVCRTLAEMEPECAFLRKEHTAFVLDSRINKAFFHCFENDSFDDSGLMKILDTGKRCAARLEEYKRMKLLNVADAVNSGSSGFEPEFLRFCQTKTKEMWALFQVSMVFKNVEERETFTGAFLDVAKGVWLLHRLAFSMNPAVVIVRVGKGMEINPLYVEPVAVADEPCASCKSPAKVEFMIMPGFRAHNKVIKCQVYPHIHCR